MTRKTITLNVNGDAYEVSVQPWQSLAEVLREELNLTGTKIGCNQGDCGACTVLFDGRPVSSCLTLAVEADGRKLLTIEGLARSPAELTPLQEAFGEKGAVQCGFCTGGMILAAHHLLETNASPSEAEIREGLSGNICRCTGYNKIVDAIDHAAKVMGGESGGAA
ncbi:MAG: (2Fe-2S)-binding protein [Deltaproteobacteria bacterium]|nr:(2Fe-2S)-binding protein [Deltaproteobacteria bacterium]